MQAAIRRVLPIARQGRLSLLRPPRLAQPRISQCFSNTSRAFQRPTEPTGSSPGTARSPGDPVPGKCEEIPATSTEEQSIDAEKEIIDNGSSRNPAERLSRTRGRPIGSKGRRIQKKEIPKPEVPQWFTDQSVLLCDGVVSSGKMRILSEAEGAETAKISEKKEPDPVAVETPPVDLEPGLEITPRERYCINEIVWKEILTNVRAGFMLPRVSFMNSFAAMKSHTLLHFPKQGGTYFLDALAEKLASEVGADFVRIDAQDLEQIAGDFLGDSQSFSAHDISPDSVRSLGYDAVLSTLAHAKQAAEEAEEEEAEEEEEPDESEDEDSETEALEPEEFRSYPWPFTTNPESKPSLSKKKKTIYHSLAPHNMPAPDFERMFQLPALAILDLHGRPNDLTTDRLNEKKMAIVLEALITAAQIKRREKTSDSPTSTSSTSVAAEPSASKPLVPARPPHKTIIQIRDYSELNRTSSGASILRIFHEVVQRLRREGEHVIILGTTCEVNFQKHPDDSTMRKIVIPPVQWEGSREIFREDKAARFREINIRHLQDMIRRRCDNSNEPVSLVVPKNWHLEVEGAEEQDIPGISGYAWDFDYVHRVVTNALGQRAESQERNLGVADIRSAIKLIETSDAFKHHWAMRELGSQEETDEIEEGVAETGVRKPKTKIPKDCTHHEKKLLGGVINPENIHTGFSSVRAPKETIEALKTLTSLSLIRPEAFKYGVLATDRIPGVLLYGPPGTGKTLLAKAVAKESGATVLEVSGSEIFDMYIGEGEKNVKAIFTLAQKLSPCVVFIDEADAIFGSRHGHSARSNHREIINQFLKEWADLTSTAFIMVATNRPFDLDDAVLRRLPRRILVDLPTPTDRLEILRIHLAAETLSPSVNLQKISEQTTLMSGSDIKNVCVSAALACVREENETFKTTGKYPEKRILEERHFEKALEEISASISDDMSSLTAIRKFDEKYGEGKGRRKKKPNWGFVVGREEDEKKATGRVRDN